jgi:adenylate cyclase
MDTNFLEAEQSGLRLAIKGRLVALVIFGGTLALTRISNAELALNYLFAIIGFSAIGILHFRIIGSRFDFPWVKYLFVTIDFGVLSFLIATQPMYTGIELPQVMMFKNAVFPYYFILLGIAAFGLSHFLVLYAGFLGVVGWMGAFYWATFEMPATLNWGDLPKNPTADQFMTMFYDPNFIATGSRVQEAFAYLTVALLIAVVIWRARQTVFLQLKLGDEKRNISQLFAQYVPEKVADILIQDQGLLAPVERRATVLFLDIAGFTSMTERVGPKKTMLILNSFFEKATNCISAQEGVVTQFIGDAIMASFNMPLEDSKHELHGVKAVRNLMKLVAEETFEGETLKIRMGLCSGPVIGGSVGGGGRQSYTVYGDTVNLASRLEALNKSHGTEILIANPSEESVEIENMQKIGQVDVRGLSEPVFVYTM